jgi:hypothetical protein
MFAIVEANKVTTDGETLIQNVCIYCVFVTLVKMLV